MSRVTRVGSEGLAPRCERLSARAPKARYPELAQKARQRIEEWSPRPKKTGRDRIGSPDQGDPVTGDASHSVGAREWR
eukprot:3170626-Pleurochrysis_carterae.AAC.2